MNIYTKSNPHYNEMAQRAAALQEIREFVQHPALLQLLEKFGYRGPDRGLDISGHIAAEQEFSNANWDFRRGKEREDAEKANLSEAEKDTTLEAAQAMGLVEAVKPRKMQYDAIVILGAKGKNPLLRTAYAAECQVEAPFIFSLSSENEFSTQDPSFKEYAPHAKTEFDLMCTAAEKVYNRTEGNSQTITLPVNRWRIRQYKKMSEPEPDIYIVSAPSSHPRRRANTADTYAFLAHLLPFDMHDLLIVTSSNFLPFQHFDARRILTLPFGKDVETVGLDTRKTIYHEAQYYLQEINSAINAASTLYRVLKDM